MLNFALQEMCTPEKMLQLALNNIAQKRGEYYLLIKDYVLYYDEIDKAHIEKIKTIIIFLQEYANKNGEKRTMKNVKVCLDKLGAKPYKNTFLRLFSLCRIYDEYAIINVISNSPI